MILLWLLLITVGCQNTAIEVGSALGVYQNFTVYWSVTNRNTVLFNIIAYQPGYFAILYSQSTNGTDLTAVEFVNGTGLVRDYYQNGITRPKIYSRNNVNVIGVVTDGATYIQAKFQRPLLTQNAQDVALTSGSLVRFALQWNLNSPTLTTYGNNMAYISGRLVNNTLINITPTPI